MGRRSDWLDRFRPAGAPGSPARPGVPADERFADREITPVFGALAATFAECDRVRAEAEAEALRETEEASRTAARILDDARELAAGVRADAAAAALASDGPDAEDADGLQAVAELQRRVADRMPAVAARVEQELRHQLSALTGVDLTVAAAEPPRVRT